MARIFDYFDPWKTERLVCPKCGWAGFFNEGEVEYYRELMDCSCPRCAAGKSVMLAIVNYPTIDDYKANWSKLSELDKKDFEAIERQLKRGTKSSP